MLPWRREHRRVRAALGVDWRRFGRAVHHLSTLGDVSAAGAFVHTAEPQPAGSPLVLDIETPAGGVALDVHARVAWTSARGMGLRFTRPLRGT
jgi:hypothetical protein